MGNRLVLNWIRELLPLVTINHNETLVTNLKEEGLLIEIITHFCTVKHDFDQLNYLQNCLEAAESQLGVKCNIIDSVALFNGSLDDETALIYLSLIRRKHQLGFHQLGVQQSDQIQPLALNQPGTQCKLEITEITSDNEEEILTGIANQNKYNTPTLENLTPSTLDSRTSALNQSQNPSEDLDTVPTKLTPTMEFDRRLSYSDVVKGKSISTEELNFDHESSIDVTMAHDSSMDVTMTDDGEDEKNTTLTSDSDINSHMKNNSSSENHIKSLTAKDSLLTSQNFNSLSLDQELGNAFVPHSEKDAFVSDCDTGIETDGSCSLNNLTCGNKNSDCDTESMAKISDIDAESISKNSDGDIEPDDRRISGISEVSSTASESMDVSLELGTIIGRPNFMSFKEMKRQTPTLDKDVSGSVTSLPGKIAESSKKHTLSLDSGTFKKLCVDYDVPVGSSQESLGLSRMSKNLGMSLFDELQLAADVCGEEKFSSSARTSIDNESARTSLGNESARTSLGNESLQSDPRASIGTTSSDTAPTGNKTPENTNTPTKITQFDNQNLLDNSLNTRQINENVETLDKHVNTNNENISENTGQIDENDKQSVPKDTNLNEDDLGSLGTNIDIGTSVDPVDSDKGTLSYESSVDENEPPQTCDKSGTSSDNTVKYEIDKYEINIGENGIENTKNDIDRTLNESVTNETVNDTEVPDCDKIYEYQPSKPELRLDFGPSLESNDSQEGQKVQDDMLAESTNSLFLSANEQQFNKSSSHFRNLSPTIEEDLEKEITINQTIKDTVAEQLSVVLSDAETLAQAPVQNDIMVEEFHFDQPFVIEQSNSGGARPKLFPSLKKSTDEPTVHIDEPTVHIDEPTKVIEEIHFSNDTATVDSNNGPKFEGDDTIPVRGPSSDNEGHDHLLKLLGQLKDKEREREAAKPTSAPTQFEVNINRDISEEDEVGVVHYLNEEIASLRAEKFKLSAEVNSHKKASVLNKQRIAKLEKMIDRLHNNIDELERQIYEANTKSQGRTFAEEWTNTEPEMFDDLTSEAKDKNHGEIDTESTLVDSSVNTDDLPQISDPRLQSFINKYHSLMEIESSTPLISPRSGENLARIQGKVELENDEVKFKAPSRASVMLDKILHQMSSISGDVDQNVLDDPSELDELDSEPECADKWRELAVAQINTDPNVQRLQKSLGNSTVEIDLMETKLNQIKQEKERVEKEYQSQLDNTRTEAQKVYDQYENLLVKTSGDQNEMDILKDRIASMEKNLATAQLENTELSERFDSTKVSVSKEEFERVRHSNNELKVQLLELVEQKNRLQKELDNIHSQPPPASAPLEPTISLPSDTTTPHTPDSDDPEALKSEIDTLKQEQGSLNNTLDLIEKFFKINLPGIEEKIKESDGDRNALINKRLDELKAHVFSQKSYRKEQKANEARRLSNASTKSADKAPSLHEDIIKQSEDVLTDIEKTNDIGLQPKDTYVHWTDVSKSIADKLACESQDKIEPKSTSDSAKSETTSNQETLATESTESIDNMNALTLSQLPEQLSALIGVMEKQYGVRVNLNIEPSTLTPASTPSVPSTPSAATTMYSPGIVQEVGNRYKVDYAKMNEEYDQLKQKRLDMLAATYTGKTNNLSPMMNRVRAMTEPNPVKLDQSQNDPVEIANRYLDESSKVTKPEMQNTVAIKERLRLMREKLNHTESQLTKLHNETSNYSFPKPAQKTVYDLPSSVTTRRKSSDIPFVPPPPKSEVPRITISKAKTASNSNSKTPFSSRKQRQIYPHKKGYLPVDEFYEYGDSELDYEEVSITEEQLTPRQLVNGHDQSQDYYLDSQEDFTDDYADQMSVSDGFTTELEQAYIQAYFKKDKEGPYIHSTPKVNGRAPYVDRSNDIDPSALIMPRSKAPKRYNKFSGNGDLGQSLIDLEAQKENLEPTDDPRLSMSMNDLDQHREGRGQGQQLTDIKQSIRDYAASLRQKYTEIKEENKYGTRYDKLKRKDSNMKRSGSTKDLTHDKQYTYDSLDSKPSQSNLLSSPSRSMVELSQDSSFNSQHDTSYGSEPRRKSIEILDRILDITPTASPREMETPDQTRSRYDAKPNQSRLGYDSKPDNSRSAYTSKPDHSRSAHGSSLHGAKYSRETQNASTSPYYDPIPGEMNRLVTDYVQQSRSDKYAYKPIESRETRPNLDEVDSGSVKYKRNDWDMKGEVARATELTDDRYEGAEKSRAETLSRRQEDKDPMDDSIRECVMKEDRYTWEDLLVSKYSKAKEESKSNSKSRKESDRETHSANESARKDADSRRTDATPGSHRRDVLSDSQQDLHSSISSDKYEDKYRQEQTTILPEYSKSNTRKYDEEIERYYIRPSSARDIETPVRDEGKYSQNTSSKLSSNSKSSQNKYPSDSYTNSYTSSTKDNTRYTEDSKYNTKYTTSSSLNKSTDFTDAKPKVGITPNKKSKVSKDEHDKLFDDYKRTSLATSEYKDIPKPKQTNILSSSTNLKPDQTRTDSQKGNKTKSSAPKILKNTHAPSDSDSMRERKPSISSSISGSVSEVDFFVMSSGDIVKKKNPKSKDKSKYSMPTYKQKHVIEKEYKGDYKTIEPRRESDAYWSEPKRHFGVVPDNEGASESLYWKEPKKFADEGSTGRSDVPIGVYTGSDGRQMMPLTEDNVKDHTKQPTPWIKSEGSKLTNQEQSYADELINKYSQAWEQSHREGDSHHDSAKLNTSRDENINESKRVDRTDTNRSKTEISRPQNDSDLLKSTTPVSKSDTSRIDINRNSQKRSDFQQNHTDLPDKRSNIPYARDVLNNSSISETSTVKPGDTSMDRLNLSQASVRTDITDTVLNLSQASIRTDITDTVLAKYPNTLNSDDMEEDDRRKLVDSILKKYSLNPDPTKNKNSNTDSDSFTLNDSASQTKDSLSSTKLDRPTYTTSSDKFNESAGHSSTKSEKVYKDTDTSRTKLPSTNKNVSLKDSARSDKKVQHSESTPENKSVPYLTKSSDVDAIMRKYLVESDSTKAKNSNQQNDSLAQNGQKSMENTTNKHLDSSISSTHSSYNKDLTPSRKNYSSRNNNTDNPATLVKDKSTDNTENKAMVVSNDSGVGSEGAEGDCGSSSKSDDVLDKVDIDEILQRYNQEWSKRQSVEAKQEPQCERQSVEAT